jgi:hypothetical protein
MLVEPGATSAEDYLIYSEKTAKEKGMAVNYKGSPRPVTINGQSFSKVEMERSTSGGEQHAEQYVTTEQQNLLQFPAGESRRGWFERPGTVDPVPEIQARGSKDQVQDKCVKNDHSQASPQQLAGKGAI